MNRITDYKQLVGDITSWIRNYAVSNNIKSLVIGISGGIDSAVVSTLCARTGLPTYICMIDIGNTVGSIEIAIKHMKWLKEQYNNVEYKHYMLYDTFSDIVEELKETTEHSEANLKSRMRMCTLYNIATCIQGIVVGTGNKVEDFGVGFCTKYGDHGVDISPIADLYKTEVRELGRYLDISQEIIDAAPTDGLWDDGRTDEQQIGATYEELEWAMNYTELMTGIQYMDTELTTRQMEVLKIYRKLHNQNQHKMQPIPIYKLPL